MIESTWSQRGTPNSCLLTPSWNPHHAKDVPAHRVVNRVGVLTGKHHFDGSNLMQQLLENEGIKVVDNQIVDFQKHFWDPAKELQ